jgi:hypothetical protein
MRPSETQTCYAADSPSSADEGRRGPAFVRQALISALLVPAAPSWCAHWAWWGNGMTWKACAWGVQRILGGGAWLVEARERNNFIHLPRLTS